MTSENLELYLKKHDSPRFAIYQNIKSACTKIWSNPRLGWYTDHGVEHSKRIVSILDEICNGLLIHPKTQQPSYGLATHEVFLLLSAAWLHDIGMQDLKDINNKTVDMLSDSDWDLVRKRHPRRSFEIIMDFASGSENPNEFQLGFTPNTNFHPPLALICMGHGSDYFEEVINIFRKRTFDLDGNNKIIRGELLTSLLLIADELDLHHSRAKLNANYPISKISRLHFFRHHYIQNVNLSINSNSDNETDKQIAITFSFPESEKDWIGDLKIWIVDKLKFEMNRTIEHIRNGFNGHFFWADPPVIVNTEPALPKEKKFIDEDVKYLLKTNAQKLIDWKTCIRNLEARFTDEIGGFIQLEAGKEDGSDLFISLLEYLFLGTLKKEETAPLLVIMNFGLMNAFHGYSEIISEISAALEFDTPPSDKEGQTASLLQQLYSSIEVLDKKCLIVLQNLDELDMKIYERLKEEICSLPISENRITILYNTKKTVPKAESVKLKLPKKFEENDILDYFLKTGNDRKISENNTKIILEMQKQNLTALAILQLAETLK